MTYMTRQQQAVLACIERFGGGCATAAELTEELHREGQSIGVPPARKAQPPGACPQARDG